MFYIAATLLFVLASVSIYALIISQKRPLIVFLLTPVLLTSSIYAGWAIYTLVGSPINGFPEGHVEILHVEPARPHIYFLALSLEEENPSHPKYYRVDYTESNRRTMMELQQRGERGLSTQGIFEPKGGQTPGGVKNEQQFILDGQNGPMKIKAAKKATSQYVPISIREMQRAERRRELARETNPEVLRDTGPHPE